MFEYPVISPKGNVTGRVTERFECEADNERDAYFKLTGMVIREPGGSRFSIVEDVREVQLQRDVYEFSVNDL